MQKVKLDVMKPWITKRITELLTFEDEVAVQLQLQHPYGEPRPYSRNIPVENPCCSCKLTQQQLQRSYGEPLLQL